MGRRFDHADTGRARPAKLQRKPKKCVWQLPRRISHHPRKDPKSSALVFQIWRPVRPRAQFSGDENVLQAAITLVMSHVIGPIRESYLGHQGKAGQY